MNNISVYQRLYWLIANGEFIFMCNAVRDLRDNGTITYEEASDVLDQIDKVLKGHETVNDMLYDRKNIVPRQWRLDWLQMMHETHSGNTKNEVQK